jgi:hypothetical protein
MFSLVPGESPALVLGVRWESREPGVFPGSTVYCARHSHQYTTLRGGSRLSGFSVGSRHKVRRWFLGAGMCREVLPFPGDH